MAEAPHWVEGVYLALVHMGINPQDWKPNYLDEESGGRAFLALPESKVALCTDGDDADLLDEAGWAVERLTLAGLPIFGRVMSSLSTAATEHKRRLSNARMVKTGSKEEERLLAAILRANLPEPDRNHRFNRDDGSELTTPDFVWQNLKIAFFMDGLWWHVGLDDDTKMKELRDISTDKEHATSLSEANRSRAERDADNRSELTTMGWHVLSCTDRDLETDEGVSKQVKRITKMMRSVMQAQKQAPAPARDLNAQVSQEDLLDIL